MASSSQTNAGTPPAADNAADAPPTSAPSLPPITVANGLDSLMQIAAYVLQAAKAAGITGRRSYRLRLAVDEIATNIFTHGYKAQGGKGNIVISAAVRPDILQITLDDTGVPYNPLDHPVPAHINLALHEREPGGLGIYLALRYVDRFCYARSGEHNYNTFIVNRLPEPDQARH